VVQHQPRQGQPPAAWLVELAERLGGTLGGDYRADPWRAVRVDIVCVPGERARDLVDAVRRD
jgi:hypothetical protein